MKILIKVTKDVLFRSRMCGLGGAGLSTNCAIAVAIRDLFPKASIGCPSMIFDSSQSDLRYDNILPSKALSFISKFDSSTPEERVNMPEFSFELPIPEEVINRISIGMIYKVLSESRTLELVHP